VSEEVVARRAVATMRFRILKYDGHAKARRCATGWRPARPRPEAAPHQDTLLLRGDSAGSSSFSAACRATRCATALPACAVCGSLDWDTCRRRARGALQLRRRALPKVRPSTTPPIGLVALEEGTRLVADLAIDRPSCASHARRGELVSFDDELTLPVFHGLPAERDEGG